MPTAVPRQRLHEVLPAARRKALLAAADIAVNNLEVHSVSVGIELGFELERARTKGYLGLRSLVDLGAVEKRAGEKSVCGWYDLYRLTAFGWWLVTHLIAELDAQRPHAVG